MGALEPDPLSLPFGKGVRVVKTDPNGLCALEKPAGMLSHPNRPSDRNRCLLVADFDAANEAYLLRNGGVIRKVWLLNRLDSVTSGLILVALETELAEVVRGCFRDRKVAKVYQALVFGHARSLRERWADRMKVTAEKETVRAGDKGGLEAATAMRRLRLVPGPPALTLLELIPQTGRTHQLRYQCAKRHLPIVGDQTYGNFQWNRDFAKRSGSKRLFLHSGSVRVEYEFKGRRHLFEASSPLPEDFTLG